MVTLEKQGTQRQGQQHAVINIKDIGTGIDPEISPRLFSKFATKSHKGTGLGLYISKNIVDSVGIYMLLTILMAKGQHLLLLYHY